MAMPPVTSPITESSASTIVINIPDIEVHRSTAQSTESLPPKSDFQKQLASILERRKSSRGQYDHPNTLPLSSDTVKSGPPSPLECTTADGSDHEQDKDWIVKKPQVKGQASDIPQEAAVNVVTTRGHSNAGHTKNSPQTAGSCNLIRISMLPASPPATISVQLNQSTPMIPQDSSPTGDSTYYIIPNEPKISKQVKTSSRSCFHRLPTNQNTNGACTSNQDDKPTDGKSPSKSEAKKRSCSVTPSLTSSTQELEKHNYTACVEEAPPSTEISGDLCSSETSHHTPTRSNMIIESIGREAVRQPSNEENRDSSYLQILPQDSCTQSHSYCSPDTQSSAVHNEPHASSYDDTGVTGHNTYWNVANAYEQPVPIHRHSDGSTCGQLHHASPLAKNLTLSFNQPPQSQFSPKPKSNFYMSLIDCDIQSNEYDRVCPTAHHLQTSDCEHKLNCPLQKSHRTQSPSPSVAGTFQNPEYENVFEWQSL